ncbi:MAG TPA: hypothetical protein VD767_01565 [Thermomicrobiales bacterium]|nr:hypothetical protein [Thermomicrobiales bacterium]
MVDASHPDQPADAAGATNQHQWRRASNLVWLGVSLAFLAFIFFGSVPARTWQLGSLHIDSKSIAGIWAVQVDRLPDQFPDWFIVPLFVGAMVVFVAGVVYGFRLLLVPDPPHAD